MSVAILDLAVSSAAERDTRGRQELAKLAKSLSNHRQVIGAFEGACCLSTLNGHCRTEGKLRQRGPLVQQRPQQQPPQQSPQPQPQQQTDWATEGPRDKETDEHRDLDKEKITRSKSKQTDSRESEGREGELEGEGAGEKHRERDSNRDKRITQRRIC